MAYDPITAAAANSRFNRLEEANRYADGPRSVGGAHRPAMRLHAAPRTLAADGGAARDGWQIAADGIGNAAAYLAPELGGWHWVAVLGPQDLGHSGAVLLTIGPDGARYAERYGSEPEAWSDMEWIAGRAVEDRACATPAEFAAILEPMAEPMAVLEPVAAMVTATVAVREPLQWVAAVVAPVAAILEPVAILEPEPVAVAAMVAEPVGRWQRVRGWVADQVAGIFGPWVDGPLPNFEFPRIVSLTDLEPEPVAEPAAAPSQPGRVRAWAADQVAAMASPWLGRGFGGDGLRPSATGAGG